MDTLSIPNSYVYKTGERVIPGSVTEDALTEHCARYLLAQEYCKGKKVLNISSGSGYGSVILLQTANEVFNADISELSIAHGNKMYGRYNNHFIKTDAQDMEFPDNFFDVVISFETIEHLPKPEQFLAESKRVLKKNGLLIVSTPNKIITSPGTQKPRNKFHFQEWDIQTFLKFLRKSFMLKELYGQNYETVQSGAQKSIITPFIGLALKYMPGDMYKYIKKSILKYKNQNVLKLKIPKKHRLVPAKIEDFSLDKQRKSYSIMLGIFKKK